MAANVSAKDGYQYPELLVVPKASQQLAFAATNESKSNYSTHLLLQGPAFMTLLAGLSSTGMKEDASRNASLIATSVGASWLLVTLGMSAVYTPYKSGHQQVNVMSEKSLEATLAKERRAEEVLYFPAYIMRRIQYISAATNFGAAIAVASLEEDNRNSKAVGFVAAAAAFLPLIFEHPWIALYDQQQDYKKKIYGPLAQLTLLPDQRTGQLMPGIDLSLRF